MPWFKVDDSLAYHPKVLAAGNTALGVWLRAGSWSARHLTDGFIPESVLATLGGTRSNADALVKAGLWITESDGWRFHDWLEYQPRADDVKLAQEARRDASSFGNHSRWHTRRGIVDPDCSLCQRGSHHP
jgi:hypothetical protein